MSFHSVTLHTKPIGKPRMTRRDKWAKRPCVVRYREWADELRAEVTRQIGQLPEPEDIVDVSWTAEFEPPPSWSKKKRAAHIGELHRQKPDRDNIDKAVLDTLWEEDSGIAAGTLRKVWSTESRITITITTKD